MTTTKITFDGDAETLMGDMPAGSVMARGSRLFIRTPEGMLPLKKGQTIGRGNDGVLRPEGVEFTLDAGSRLYQYDTGLVVRQSMLFAAQLDDIGKLPEPEVTQVAGKHRLSGAPLASTCEGCKNHKKGNKTAGSCKVAKALGIRASLRKDDLGCTLNPKAIPL